MIVISTISTALLVLYFRLRGGLKDFSVSYSIERPEDYVRTVFLDSNRKYRIEHFSYQKEENIATENPRIEEGILDKEAFRLAKRLIQRSNLERMKQFPADTIQKGNKGLYKHFICLRTKQKEKKILLPDPGSCKLPGSLVKLIDFFHAFLGKAS